MEIAKRFKEYEDKIYRLEKQILTDRTELTTLRQRCEQYAQAYDNLKHQVIELRRNRFGRKSERFIDDNHPQRDLFAKQKLETLPAPTEGTATDFETITYRRKKRKRFNAKKNLPRRIEIIAVSDIDKQCDCGACKEVIRYEPKEVLNYQPAVFEVIEQRREVVVCPNGCEGAMRIAPAPLHVLPKVGVSEEFLAFLMVGKIDDRQPFYHLAKQLAERYGINCSRSTMARWAIALMSQLQPLFNLLKEYIIDNPIASCDATHLQVLKEPGRLAKTKSYVYCMRGGPADKRVVLYAYNDRKHKQFIDEWFEGFQGYLGVDGDDFFERLGARPGVNLVHCFAHARRKFEPIAKSATGNGLAKKAMRYFKELYKIERKAKNHNLTSEERYVLRTYESKPLLEEFHEWLIEITPTVLPQSPLGKAINYCLTLWSGLIRFLEDGRLEIDNNLTEQQIKPFVIGRKNFLFAETVDGAHALCLHFSLIRTAKQQGLDPYHYYVAILKNIPHCKTVEDYEALLPWNMPHLKVVNE